MARRRQRMLLAAAETRPTVVLGRLPSLNRERPLSGVVRNPAVELAIDVKTSLLSADQWAILNYGRVDLGDKRLNERAVRIAAKVAEHPEFSLPNQIKERSELMAAYAFLNNSSVSLPALLKPHRELTLAAARQFKVVLMVEDSTELNFTNHPSTTGLGPVGDGKGRGLILHSTLAIVPEHREVLGLAHAQVVLRQPKPKPQSHHSNSPEALVWEESVRNVGRPSEDQIWVHVSDRGSDLFGYMAACLDHGKHFLLRAFHNRSLSWGDGQPEVEDEQARRLIDYARTLSPRPDAGYAVKVPAHDAHGKKQAAREAKVVLQWAPVTIPPPAQAPPELRSHSPLSVWVLRVWEEQPPAGAQRVEWILISSLPIVTTEDAYRAVDWYTCRWLCEDFHQALKTGCRVEHSQLDDGEDIQRLLGFLIPETVRLLQLREAARHTPDILANKLVDPLMVATLARRQKKSEASMTVGEFLSGVATLGGHLGRRGDGPPGWRTLWRGWQQLSDLTAGARLFLEDRRQL